MVLKKLVPDDELRIYTLLLFIITLILGVGSIILIVAGLPDQIFLWVIAILNFAILGLVIFFILPRKAKT